MKDKLKGVVGESSIVLHYGGEAITIQFELTLSASEILEQGLKNGTGKNKTN